MFGVTLLDSKVLNGTVNISSLRSCRSKYKPIVIALKTFSENQRQILVRAPISESQSLSLWRLR